MMRITLFSVAMLAAGTASAADCKRFTDVIDPVSRNFEGVALTQMTESWHVLAQPVLAADNCTVLRKGERQRNRAAVHCIWLMTQGSEQQARAAYDAWAKPLTACRSAQRTASSSKPRKPTSVEQLVTKDAQDNEAWVISLDRREQGGWVVGVMGSVREPNTASPSYQPASSSTPPAYRPSTTPPVYSPSTTSPVPVIKTAPPATPSVSAGCKPLLELVQMARAVREAPGEPLFGDIYNQTTLREKYFGGQGCTGSSRANAPGEGSIICATLALNADHKAVSKRIAAERASLVASCFPTFRRMDAKYGTWFTSPDGTLQISASWHEATGYSTADTTVTYTPPK